MCRVWRGYDVAGVGGGEFTLRLVSRQRVAPLYWRSDTHTHTRTYTHWTSTKCGPKCVSRRRTLSCSRLQPNVAQNVPLVGGLCHAADFDQMWPNMCPLLEDFVTQWTLTKCGPNMCPLMGDFILLRGSTTYGSTMYSSSKKAGTKQTDSNYHSSQN
jgi:hypothetical protein